MPAVFEMIKQRRKFPQTSITCTLPMRNICKKTEGFCSPLRADMRAEHIPLSTHPFKCKCDPVTIIVERVHDKKDVIIDCKHALFYHMNMVMVYWRLARYVCLPIDFIVRVYTYVLLWGDCSIKLG